MQTLVLIVHVLVAISVIALVLLQHGKGADVGAAFGSGSSNTMFGSVGALPFLVRLTGILAAVFFATSIILSYYATPHNKPEAGALPVPVTSTVPLPENNNPSLPVSK